MLRIYTEGRIILSRKTVSIKPSFLLQIRTIVDAMNNSAGDLRCKLTEKCKDFVAYSVATDEITDDTDILQLTVI
jgi:hypothetical protein